MTSLREVKQKPVEDIRGNVLDKAIAFFAPGAGVSRMRDRAIMAMASTAYHGASRKRAAVSEWKPAGGDADSDSLSELQDLRDRSRDLVRNNPMGGGAINTKVTNVVGQGLKLQARIDREILGMTEEQAEAWERRTEAEWRLFSESKNCDAARVLDFAGLTELAFRSVLEAGDTLVTTPMGLRPGSPYALQLQLIEADRICNKAGVADTESLAGGVRKGPAGDPVAYQILKTHPGASGVIGMAPDQWIEVPAFGAKTGRVNAIHLFHKRRIGQTRGIPDLAPVIELIKQIGGYTDSEAQAAVISSFFTVFIKSDMPNSGLPSLQPMQPTANLGGKTSDKNYKMGAGAILDLAQNEDVILANPSRPNTAFDPFILALSRQIGMALELPYEILIKHFTSSYSAARAAIEEAWRFFMTRRMWLVSNLCRPVYELFMTEAVARGRIVAPGFLNGDPLIRMAFLGSDWNGPTKPQIDELKAVNAAEKRVEMGLTTLAKETAIHDGGDWDRNHVQRVKEVTRRKADGLEETITSEGGAGQ